MITLVATLGIVAWPRVTHALGIKPKPATMPYIPGGHIDTPADWYSVPTSDADRLRASGLRRVPEGAAVLSVSSSSSSPAARRWWWLAAPMLAIRTRQFARLIGVNDAGVQTVPAGLRVRATPTLVLVDRQGRILAAWEGVGPPEKQNAIARRMDEILK